MPANDNELNLIDAAIIKFKGYLEGKNDFDELDFKEAITDYATRRVIDELQKHRRADAPEDRPDATYGIKMSHNEVEEVIATIETTLIDKGGE